MQFIFKSGYICCGCGKRYTIEHTNAIFKRSCICNECYSQIEKVPHYSSFAGTKYCDFVVSPFFYKDLYRDIFLQFKFSGCFAYGHILGMKAAEYFNDFTQMREYDGIVIVPLSKQRLRERGFNQSEIMGKYIAEALDLPIINCIQKVIHTQTQSNLKGLDRINNVKNSFKITQPLTDKRIIIFDDIFTTGSTINEVARVIKNAGAKTVCAITAGYVYHELKPQLY